MNADIPKPEPNERPTSYADRLGRWYSTTVSTDHKKRNGQYLTPIPVADYMARLFQPKGKDVRLLDPGAGSGVLTCAVGECLATGKRKLCRLYAEVYETDPDLAALLEESLAYLRHWLSSQGIGFEAAIEKTDFLMAYSGLLNETFGKNSMLFKTEDRSARFDVAISNPPYFKIPKSDPRAISASAVIHGQPNIYALFMAASASALKPGGQFVFITPRSYTSGPYFRLFRERFFGLMKPHAVHVFDSRTDAFKRDDILQENVITKAYREEGWSEKSNRGHVWISASNGSGDFNKSKVRKVQTDLILNMSSEDKVLHIPTTDEQLNIMKMVRSWPGSLRSYGLEISTGPVVPFRSTPLLDDEGDVPLSHAPLMWMQHVKAMKCQWPIPGKKKPQYIKIIGSAMKLLVPNKNYVLLRRFSAKEEKRRLVAAPFLTRQLATPWLGLENHLNYVHRPGGEMTEDEAMGLSVLYNSCVLDTYFRTLNGNTQVSATELRAMPLPEKRLIVALGEQSKALEDPGEIEELAKKFLEQGKTSESREGASGVKRTHQETVREATAIG